MKLINKTTLDIIEGLALSEAQFINSAFKLSKSRGLLHFSNAVTSFKRNFLKSVYGDDVIFSLCTEYGFFIIQILKNIDNCFMELTLRDLIIPVLYDITDKDLIVILKEVKGLPS